MNVVVDTNVVAYYLLKTEPFTRECALFWCGPREVYAPMSWEIELVNTVWLAIGAGVLDLGEGIERLRLGGAAGNQLRARSRSVGGHTDKGHGSESSRL